jgi:cellulose synthase/poly-beta-1,6-N-acetylglucosamine synthase-like glycosyltransferase
MWFTFYFPLAVLFYVYGGYPGIVWMLARGRAKKTQGSPANFWPSVSIVVSTRDRANEVRKRIENLRALVYHGPVELLIGCDDSAEAYQAAVEFGSSNSKVHNFPRIGKASVQNRLVAEATGEIVVTTDAQTRFLPDFLTQITRPFADPRVGGVTGIMWIENKDNSGTAHTEANYWSYEQWLRQQESDAGLLVGVVGACFAFRRTAYREIGEASDTDNLVPLQLAEQGYKTVQQPAAVVMEEAIENTAGEFKNRTRTVTRSFVDYLRHFRLFNPIRYPGYCLAILSHKLLRWLTPHFSILLWVGAFVLRANPICRVVFLLGTLAVGAGISGWLLGRHWRLPSLWSVFVSVLVVNLAFLAGTSNVIRRKKIVTW